MVNPPTIDAYPGYLWISWLLPLKPRKKGGHPKEFESAPHPVDRMKTWAGVCLKLGDSYEKTMDKLTMINPCIMAILEAQS